MACEPEIYCPKCTYRPVAEDRWTCIPSCGTSWHTFWTGGVCPGCHWQWTVTQCPRCGELSPHRDWYHYPEGERSDVEEDEHIPEPANT
jgi:hypothetical protein